MVGFGGLVGEGDDATVKWNLDEISRWRWRWRCWRDVGSCKPWIGVRKGMEDEKEALVSLFTGSHEGRGMDAHCTVTRYDNRARKEKWIRNY